MVYKRKKLGFMGRGSESLHFLGVRRVNVDVGDGGGRIEWLVKRYFRIFSGL